MKYETLVQAKQGLEWLAQMDIPVGLAIKVAVFCQKVQPLLDVYKDKEVEILKKYGTLSDERTGTYKISDVKAFQTAMQALKNTSIEVGATLDISIDDLQKVAESVADDGTLKVKSETIYKLLPLLGNTEK